MTHHRTFSSTAAAPYIPNAGMKSKTQGGKNKRESSYKSYDELPLFLNAEMTTKLLGISISSMYELMHEKDFPVLKIGTRLVVPKEKFRAWVEQNVGK